MADENISVYQPEGTIPVETDEYYLIKKSTLTAMADAIRAKDGTIGTIDPANFATKIGAIETSVAPTISVSSSGLITATSGDKSATKQLTTQAATTITPGTSSQTAVSSGRYTTGNIYVAGDSNLVAENIKSGVSIFGVDGSLSAGLNSAYFTDPSSLTLDLVGGCTELAITAPAGMTINSSVVAICGWFAPKESYEFYIGMISDPDATGYRFVISELDDVEGIGDLRFRADVASGELFLTEDGSHEIYSRIASGLNQAFAPNWYGCGIYIFWTN